jgi:hypothetical protein
MRRRMLACVVAVFTAAAGVIASAPAQADPPQCGDSPIVEYNCQAGDLCTAVIDGQCVGAQPPMLPPPPDVRVGVKGDIGIGIG